MADDRPSQDEVNYALLSGVAAGLEALASLVMIAGDQALAESTRERLLSHSVVARGLAVRYLNTNDNPPEAA